MSGTEPCEHQWITYYERLPSNRTPDQVRKTADVTKVPIAAYFKTQECTAGCGKKVRTNYRVGSVRVPEGADVREFQP